MFCIYLRTNSDSCHLQHKLIGFYNRDEKCLQRGTDWVFKQSGLLFVFKRLICLFLFSTCFGQLCAHYQQKLPYLWDTVTLYGWLSGVQGGIPPCTPDSYPLRVTNTKCHIGTVFSPDDGHITEIRRKSSMVVASQIVQCIAVTQNRTDDSPAKNTKEKYCTSLHTAFSFDYWIRSHIRNWHTANFMLPFYAIHFSTLRTGSFKLFKRPFPGFLTILTL